MWFLYNYFTGFRIYNSHHGNSFKCQIYISSYERTHITITRCSHASVTHILQFNLFTTYIPYYIFHCSINLKMFKGMVFFNVKGGGSLPILKGRISSNVKGGSLPILKERVSSNVKGEGLCQCKRGEYFPVLKRMVSGVCHRHFYRSHSTVQWGISSCLVLALRSYNFWVWVLFLY